MQKDCAQIWTTPLSRPYEWEGNGRMQRIFLPQMSVRAVSAYVLACAWKYYNLFTLDSQAAQALHSNFAVASTLNWHVSKLMVHIARALPLP